jgi:hypothetical protein
MAQAPGQWLPWNYKATLAAKTAPGSRTISARLGANTRTQGALHLSFRKKSKRCCRK